MEQAKGFDYTESVYNLLFKAPEECENDEQPKKPLYKSVYSSLVKEEAKKNKDGHRTMGPPEEPLPQPQKFLKKHAKDFKPPEKPVARPNKERRSCCKSVPVPKRSEMKEMLKQEETKKDFVSLNATQVALSQPAKPIIKQIDSRKGDAFVLPTSGLQPLFVHKKDYGKVPVYIEHRKKELNEAQKQYEAYLDESVGSGNIKQISEEERTSMIEGLKNNWDALFQVYQKMSLTIDTLGKKKRKIQLEAEMKQLEKDISLLEGYPTIYLLQIGKF